MSGPNPVELSRIRLLAMRAMYLVMAVGLTLVVWPLIIDHPPDTPNLSGAAWALLGTIGLLSYVGLRYPVQMLPLLLFELVWKLVWLGAFAFPLWLSGELTEADRSTAFDTALGLVLLLVIPWGHVWRHYVRKPAERAAGPASPDR